MAADKDRKTRILFVDSGNICSSVMAQYMMQTMVDSIGAGDRFLIDSASTSKVRQNTDIYPQARKKLEEMNVPVGNHAARQMLWEDYDRFDLLIGMNQTNIDDMRYIVGSDPDGKISKLSAFRNSDEDIEDPWYTDDFDTAGRAIQEALMGLLNRLS